MIGVIYPVFNRKEYVEITFPALVQECLNSKYFGELLVIDDMSEDGAGDFCEAIVDKYHDWPFRYMRLPVGNSWGQWNLSHNTFSSRVTHLANFTNENWIPTGGLDILYETFEEDTFAVGGQLGPKSNGNYYPGLGLHEVKEVTIIGSGLICRDKFNQLGAIRGGVGENKYFGFGRKQNEAKKEGWKILQNNRVQFIRLDQSPIYSRAQEYHEKGWSRMLNAQPSIINPKECTKK